MNTKIFNAHLGAVLGSALIFSTSLIAQAPAGQAQPQTNPVPAAAAPQSFSGQPSKVATVNIQRAIQECAEGKKAAEDLSKQFTPKRAELERKQGLVAQKQKQLQDGEKLLNDEQKSQLARDIDRLTKDFNRDNDDSTAEYQAAMETTINAIGSKMIQVIGGYAQKNGFDLVINSANQGEVLFQTNRLDITNEIVNAYNTAFGAGSAPATPSAPAASGPKPGTTAPAGAKPATPAVKKP